jgi:tetratricopeptide (TPR) repeat protein
MLLLCLGLPGCSPTAESQLDEQKNPHYQSGKSRLSALDYKGAVESFERAVEDNPRSALAHYELGVLFDQHENDYAAALYHYNKALKLRPSGYPAENIRQRIPACKQELVKADSLAIINPSALRETETLREQNQALRKQVESLQAYIASRLASSADPPPTRPLPAARDYSRPAPVATNAQPATSRTDFGGTTRVTPLPDHNQSRPATAGTRSRTHSVRAGDTPYSISRQYQIKLNSLLSANPGLDPKRLRVGQILNIPSS